MRTTYTTPFYTSVTAPLFVTTPRMTARETSDACREIVEHAWTPLIATPAGAQPYADGEVVGCVRPFVLDAINATHEVAQHAPTLAGHLADAVETLDALKDAATPDGDMRPMIDDAHHVLTAALEVAGYFEGLAERFGGASMAHEVAS